MIEFTDINKNLPYGQNMGGVQQAIYFGYHADVASFPAKPVNPVTLEANATLTGNLVMKPGKRMFKRIHPSVTIFGKTYRCIALQEINEL
jgi:hypothetical protein